MPRSINSSMLGSLLSNDITPCFLLDITLSSGTAHVWSGVGTLTYNGWAYQGVGSLGNIGDITEGTTVNADGTTVTLSGIDSTLITDVQTDIQIGAPATIWFALLNNGQIVGAAYPLFVGTVDKPTIHLGTDTISITLALENRLMTLRRPTARRYTSADQRIYYSDDSGFTWVELLNDIALRWGN